MSIRESYNELTWKIYRLVHKPIFWIAGVLAIACICGVAALIYKADDIAYNRVMQSPSIAKCTKYIDKHPDSEHTPDVKILLEQLLFQKEQHDYEFACGQHSLTEYRKFIDEHPDSMHASEIESKIIELEYQLACESDNVQAYRAFIGAHPDDPHIADFNKRIKAKEDSYFKSFISIPNNQLNRDRINEYLTVYPQGRYIAQAQAKLKILDDEDAYQKASASDSRSAWTAYLTSYPNGLHASHARARIAEMDEIERCRNNSLPNGSQPYASYYGNNYSYAYDRAYVEVKASDYTDVVVIVRYNNSEGSVAGHTYVHKGCRSTIYLLPNNRYQVFFYYGKGWYPKKQMSGGVKGGFLESEDFDKDGSSMYLGRGEGVEYTLTQVVNGNFSTTNSNSSEFF